MTSRERLLNALNNEKADRLPCQVHGWMQYYLDNYLDGMDQWQAYEKFDMDFVIYNHIKHEFDQRDLANWRVEKTPLPAPSPDSISWREVITTPEGTLSQVLVKNPITFYETEHLVKTKEDFELFNKYWPVPNGIDITGVQADKEKLGNRGLIRTYGYIYYPGQGSPWQALCYLMGTEPTIMNAFDDESWMHYALESLLEKSQRTLSLCSKEQMLSDVIETGGGAGSNTVISPSMFEKFCLPYDKKQNQTLQELGTKVVYHLCGGMMAMGDMVVESGADGFETMTPPAMGGDCDLALASEKWGDKLFFIGGFDQNAGFESGNPEDARRLVRECFEATKDHGGYIVSPSDHFFNGSPDNIQAFVDEAKKCYY
ncbi:MAG: uroporphyrinogen decarboxylase family protein [Sedimentisphaeraceae bacterium JB056]